MKKYNFKGWQYKKLRVICKHDGNEVYCRSLAYDGTCMCDEYMCKNAVAVVATDQYEQTTYLALEE